MPNISPGNTSGKTIGPDAYPDRSLTQMYFNDLVLWLCQSETAAIVGSSACWLLTVIARKEHELRYSRAPLFWNSELMMRCGFSSVETLIAARQKLVDAGLLHYAHGRKGAAGVYWCLWVDDSVGDSLGMQSGFPRDAVENSDCITEGKQRETSNLSIPVLVPSPIPKRARTRAGQFTPPTVDEVQAYCLERGNRIDPQTFVTFYAAKGWRIGTSPMKDWRAAVKMWEARDNKSLTQNPTRVQGAQVDADFAALERKLA